MDRKPETSNYDLQRKMAQTIFMEYDHAGIARKFGLQADERWIYLEYFCMPCRISTDDGSIQMHCQGAWQMCHVFNTAMTIYDLLCYHQGPVLPSLTGQWCTVGNFVITGVTNTETFTGKYATLFDGCLAELKAACQSMGGVLQAPMAGADLTCRFAVTPFFPVLLQFWAGDDEFPPKILLLWDRNADCFLRFETMFFLQGDLLERLWRHME